MYNVKINKLIIFLFLITILLLLSNVSSYAKDHREYTSKEFLNISRNSHPKKTWAELIGTVSNKRRDTTVIHAQIKLGMRFTSTRILAKIFIEEDDSNNSQDRLEIYTVGQPYTGELASIIASEKDDELSLLGDLGLRPEDLTMTFLHWNFNKELDMQSVKTLDCRVLELVNPETNEHVIVYISLKYFTPIKIKWFNKNTNTPYRTVVVSAFETEGDLGAPSELNIYGPGWRSKVDFTNIKLGYTKDGLPNNLFSEDF